MMVVSAYSRLGMMQLKMSLLCVSTQEEGIPYDQKS